jgi:hypothetical protein
MGPNMSSGVLDVSAHDEKRLMEELDTYMVAQDSRHANIYPQPQHNDLDESEPEVVSESDEDEEEEIFFKPSPPLPSPNVIKRTMRELRDLMNTPYLNLDSTEHRPRHYDGNDTLTGIIDSLSQNYDFPPIFFNQKQVRGPDGSIQYNRVCIDGLKRLSSIKAFMEGDIPCHDYRRRKWYYCSKAEEGPEAQTASDRRYLPDDVKKDFENKHFICHEFEDLSGVEEIELRARVHLGNTLTPGEKLRATMVFSGDLMMNFAKVLHNDFQQIANLSDTRRLKGFQNLMKCSAQILEVQKAVAEKRQPVLRISDTALNSFTKHADASTLKTIREALGVFSMLVSMHPAEFSEMARTPFSSMEMIAIAVLTLKYYNTKIKPWVLIRLVDSLRQSLHNFSHHQGVLQTHQNWQHAWDCIQGFDRFVAEGETSVLSSAVQQGMQSNALKDEEQDRSLIQNKSFAGKIEQPGESRASSATFSSFSLQNSTAKRKGSPHPLDPAKKRVHLPTPVSPAILQSPRVSLRADSPDSVLGSDGSEGEQVTEDSETVMQKATTAAQEPDMSTSPEPAPRQLVRSSFKRRSEFVPRRSQSPTSISTFNTVKLNSSALSTLIASVPAPSPLKAVSSPQPGLNIQFGTSQKPAVKASLLYSHETKRTVPYQSSATPAAAGSPGIQDSDDTESAADVEQRRKSQSPIEKRLASLSGSEHVTPIQQSPNPGRPETQTMPPYSGRGRPRKYPPKPATPEGLKPRGRGRPNKNSDILNPEPPRVQAYGVRGRPRKNTPGGFSTRSISVSTSQPPSKPNAPSSSLQRKPNQATLQASLTPSPPRIFSRLSGRPRKDLIPSSTPSSTKSPSPSLQEPKRGVQGTGNALPSKIITSHPADPKVERPKQPQQVHQALESAIRHISVPADDVNLGKLSVSLPSIAQEASTAPQPPNSTIPSAEPPFVPPPTNKSSALGTQSSKDAASVSSACDPDPSAPATMQSRAVSISSSREPSLSLMSPVGSMTNATLRATPDPSLVDAKPFVAPFKVGGAKAIAERRRQQQLELQERKRKLQSEKITSPTVEFSKPKE